MSKITTSYRIKVQNALCQLNFSAIGWVDIFTGKAYRDIVIDPLCYFENPVTQPKDK